MATKGDAARGLQSSGIQQNASLPFLLGCCCIGLILLAAALTIVMALIPTYLPNKADGMSRVNATNMEAYLASRTTSRKRQTSSLDSYEGCTFGDSGLSQIRNILRQYVLSGAVRDVHVPDATLGYLASTPADRKRSVLDRETRQTDSLIYLIHIFFELDPTCLLTCQLNVASMLQQQLANIPPSAMVLNDVPMYRDGEYQGSVSSLRIDSFPYISKLSPGKTKGRPGKAPTFRARTTTPSMPSTTMSG